MQTGKVIFSVSSLNSNVLLRLSKWRNLRLIRHFSENVAKPVGPIRFSKLVNSGDIQLWEMVQGGLIMRLLETSADIVANIHANRFSKQQQEGKTTYASLAGIERVDMISSATIGNVLELFADVIHAGTDNMRCHVAVYKRTIEEQNIQQLISRSWLWYVPLYSPKETSDLSDRQVVSNYEEDKLDKLNRDFYINRLKSRKNDAKKSALHRMRDNIVNSVEMQIGVQKSLLSTSYHIAPAECSVRGYLKGGPMMVWIDELAAVIAVNFSNKQCVTRSMDNITFFAPVKQGSNLTLYGRPAFKSQRTLEIQVVGFLNSADGLTQSLCLEAFVSFVTLNASEGTPVPNIKIENDDDAHVFKERERYYTERKKIIDDIKNNS